MRAPRAESLRRVASAHSEVVSPFKSVLVGGVAPPLRDQSGLRHCAPSPPSPRKELLVTARHSEEMQELRETVDRLQAQLSELQGVDVSDWDGSLEQAEDKLKARLWAQAARL